MEPHDLKEASRGSLFRLMAFERSDESLWEATDLHAILCHQLDAEVEFDLTHFGGIAKETVTSVAGSRESKGPCTFGRLFTDLNPPLEMLDMTRRFAKRSRTQGPDGMPDEIATVLYYAAIAAARLRHEASISKLDDRSLLDGLDWALDQPWLVASLRGLLAETAQALRLPEAETDD